jgi:hypothetical protein
MAAEALDALLLIPLLPFLLARRLCTGGTGGLGSLGGSTGTGGIRITFVSPVQVHHPRTTVGALGPLSLELIFSKLNREAFPKSSPSIKPLYFGLHDASATPLFTNVAHPRSPRSSQRYTKLVLRWLNGRPRPQH